MEWRHNSMKTTTMSHKELERTARKHRSKYEDKLGLCQCFQLSNNANSPSSLYLLIGFGCLQKNLQKVCLKWAVDISHFSINIQFQVGQSNAELCLIYYRLCSKTQKTLLLSTAHIGICLQRQQLHWNGTLFDINLSRETLHFPL